MKGEVIRPPVARKSLVALTICAIVVFVLLLWLGTWQVERLHWKEGLIAERQVALAAPPAALPATLAEARALEYHRVRVAGTFLEKGEFRVHAISEAGDPGYDVVTPMALARGGTVLVDRGFVPEDRAAPANRAAGNPTGEVAVTGLLRIDDGKPSSFTPENRPDAGDWYWIDPTAMAAKAALRDVPRFYVDADATPNPGGYPVGGQTFAFADLPNNHRQYAATWYELAALLVVYYIALVVRVRRGRT
jgi:surfeit locus 1 family protein